MITVGNLIEKKMRWLSGEQHPDYVIRFAGAIGSALIIYQLAITVRQDPALINFRIVSILAYQAFLNLIMPD